RGLEALEYLRKLVAAVALQPLPGSVDEQAQVRARIGVERGQNLVEVDVRRCVGDWDREARRGHGGGLGTWVDLDEHVLQPRTRTQQRGRIGVDQVLVGVGDPQLHDRAAV